jgi:hypothetical protein
MKEINGNSTVATPTDELWSVLVIYEDTATRARAMAMCDRLVKNFWTEVEFNFHWWRTDFLADPIMSRSAMADAAEADIVIFSSAPEATFSPMLLTWFREWVAQRPAREGMLLDLTDAAALTSLNVQHKQTLLRDLAGKAQLDYFCRIPPPLSGEVPNSWQDLRDRTHHVSSLLDDILTRLPPPTHHGLNE